MKYRTLGKTGLNVSVVGLGGIPVQRITPEKTRELLERLVQLGVNFIDTARGYTVSEEYLGAALQDAVKAGKVRHIGATAHSVDALAELLRHPEIETVMFPYNIVENQGEALFAQAKLQNVGVIVMKPMAGGSIEDGTLAMRYILRNENCTVAIPGMAELAEAEENAAAAGIEGPLTEDELARIETIREQLSGNFCRRCGYCAPCTVGIDIPSCFLMEGYLKRYDLADWARTRYAAMSAKASACIGCGKCEMRCPYELPIREKLREVAAAFGE